jgi:hypothetical protein
MLKKGIKNPALMLSQHAPVRLPDKENGTKRGCYIALQSDRLQLFAWRQVNDCQNSSRMPRRV